MGTISLSKEEIDFIVEKTAVPDKQGAIEYFAYLMMLEKINIKEMPKVVRKMMQRDRKKK